MTQAKCHSEFWSLWKERRSRCHIVGNGRYLSFDSEQNSEWEADPVGVLVQNWSLLLALFFPSSGRAISLIDADIGLAKFSGRFPIHGSTEKCNHAEKLMDGRVLPEWLRLDWNCPCLGIMEIQYSPRKTFQARCEKCWLSCRQTRDNVGKLSRP